MWKRVGITGNAIVGNEQIREGRTDCLAAGLFWWTSAWVSNGLTLPELPP